MSQTDELKALENFYKLKFEYNKKILERKEDPTNINKKIVPNCINCNKIGGTNFEINTINKSSKNNENNNLNDYLNTKSENKKPLIREYIASCNATNNKCNLNIKILIGHTFSLIDILKDLQDQISKKKNDIICCKNNLIFGYDINNNEKIIDEEINKFQNLTKYYEFFLEQKNKQINDKNEEILNLKTNIEENILQLKNLMQNQSEEYSRKQTFSNFYDDLLKNKVLFREKISKEIMKIKNNKNDFDELNFGDQDIKKCILIQPEEINHFLFESTLKQNKVISNKSNID